MDLERRISLVKEVGEEILTEEELRTLLSTKKNIVAYDGFEPSGKMHVAQGLMRSININKMNKAGCKFKILVADWHALANNKMGGNLEAIQKVGDYMIEVWKASGMDLDNVKFVWASDLVKNDEYWKTVIDVARASTLNRIIRTVQIMGRSEKDTLSAAQIIYPCMQAADIFYLKADIAQLGIDQRKINILAREIGSSLGFWKPVVVSHHMLAGLKPPTGLYQYEYFEFNKDDYTPQQMKDGSSIRLGGEFPKSKEESFPMIYETNSKPRPFSVSFGPGIKIGNKLIMIKEVWESEGQPTGFRLTVQTPDESVSTEERALAMKMSKSIPDSAIFMTDSEEDVKHKISKAYCPDKTEKENPILEYYKYMIFQLNKSVTIERSSKFGGPLDLESYADLSAKYLKGDIHPIDVKNTAASYINKALDPVRKHFQKNKKAAELLKFVETAKVTR